MKIADRWRNRITPYPVEEVTDIRSGVENATAGGLNNADVATIWQSVVDCYQEGLHPAISLCIRRHGEVVLDRSIGHVTGNGPDKNIQEPLVQATTDTLFSLFSASKSISSIVMHHMEENGLLSVNDRVTEYWLDFGHNGKEMITIAHLLSHTAGVPVIPAEGLDLEMLNDPEAICDVIENMTAKHVPGRVLAYHALTGGFILNEVTKRITGGDMRAYLQKHILDPLGFEHMNYGVAPAEVPNIARHYMTGEKPFPPFSWGIARALGAPFSEVVDISNEPLFHSSVIPSGNVVANANEASRFYQMILNGGELDGIRVLEPKTIRRALVEQSYGRIDGMLGFPVRYSNGFWLGSKFLNLYGVNTQNAFGHMGFTAVVVWADYDRDISVALLNSGKPFITLGSLKWINIMRTISKVIPRYTHKR